MRSERAREICLLMKYVITAFIRNICTTIIFNQTEELSLFVTMVLERAKKCQNKQRRLIEAILEIQDGWLFLN